VFCCASRDSAADPLCYHYEVDTLSREDIAGALESLDLKLGEACIHAKCYLVGGAVLCLALNARPATKDVDAWFSEPQAVRAAAKRVALERGLPEDWLNDAAKGFIPQAAIFETWKVLPNLEILIADERTLLAMKCAAARTQEDSNDIVFLANRLHLATADEVMEVLLQFYPVERLTVRSQLLIAELFQ
jgi:hypothetical protein